MAFAVYRIGARSRRGEEGHDVVLVAPPVQRDRRIALAPIDDLERHQLLNAGFGVLRLVGGTQRRHNGLTVLPSHELKRMVYQVDDAGLDGCLRNDGVDRFGGSPSDRRPPQGCRRSRGSSIPAVRAWRVPERCGHRCRPPLYSRRVRAKPVKHRFLAHRRSSRLRGSAIFSRTFIHLISIRQPLKRCTLRGSSSPAKSSGIKLNLSIDHSRTTTVPCYVITRCSMWQPMERMIETSGEPGFQIR